MDWGVDEGLAIIRIDTDPREISRLMSPRLGIVADAKKALAALIPALVKTNRQRPSREEELSQLKATVTEELNRKLAPQMAYLQVLREELPGDGFLVSDLTQIGYVSRIAFPVYTPRTLLTAGYQGTLGYGLATALGAKIAHPDKKVLSINGDGGFMYNVQELSTAVKHNIDVVAVVFNDSAYGNVKRMQIHRHGGRVIATDLQNPDFVNLAKSFGANAYRAESPEALRATLRQAFDQKGPSVIDVPVDLMPDPWPFIMLPRVRPTTLG
jgi:acetolactate synthase-1/2/3 large subunit